MAQRAILRESGGDVIRRFRGLIVLQVAGRAGRAERLELPVGVALRASDRRVFASQREPGLRMIELRTRPLRGGVARLAIL